MFSISLKFTPMSCFTPHKNCQHLRLYSGKGNGDIGLGKRFVTNNSELGTRQLFRLTATRQRNKGKELQGQEKIRKMLRFAV